jgi:hypothetical protein
LRHFAAEDKRLGGPADRTHAGSYQQFARRQTRQLLRSDLASTRSSDPKCSRLSHRENNPARGEVWASRHLPAGVSNGHHPPDTTILS